MDNDSPCGAKAHWDRDIVCPGNASGQGDAQGLPRRGCTLGYCRTPLRA